MVIAKEGSKIKPKIIGYMKGNLDHLMYASTMKQSHVLLVSL